MNQIYKWTRWDHKVLDIVKALVNIDTVNVLLGLR